jgi:hypothetical protein
VEPALRDIEPIYHAALEKEAGRERSAYLDAACGQNATLRAGVEALLRACEGITFRPLASWGLVAALNGQRRPSIFASGTAPLGC